MEEDSRWTGGAGVISPSQIGLRPTDYPTDANGRHGRSRQVRQETGSDETHSQPGPV